ncbi:MAG TPA: ElyC/SanA/YdcF family protein [Candidatus Saccharimonadales bacterium]
MVSQQEREKEMLREMVHYLSRGGGAKPEEIKLAGFPLPVMFGRYDKRLAQRAVELYKAGVILRIVPTGGRGKDSGDLTVPEAIYLTDEMVKGGIPREHIFPEVEASNGGENAKNSLHTANEHGILDLFGDLLVIAHSTSAHRLALTLDHEAQPWGWRGGEMIVVTSGYVPNYNDPKDRYEILGEMVRVYDYAEKGFLTRDPKLFGGPKERDPRLLELVEYARANLAEAKAAAEAA